MARMFDDPLLGFARAGTLFCMFVVAAGAVISLLGVPFTLIAPPLVGEALAEHLPGKMTPSTFYAIAGLLALVTALLAVVYLFLRHMLRIIDTVAQGDPFIPVNADRLRSMAWLMLAIQIIALAVGALADFIEQSVEGEVHSLSFEFDLNSWALVLLLLILARVFRRGAEMRDDLEGTV